MAAGTRDIPPRRDARRRVTTRTVDVPTAPLRRDGFLPAAPTVEVRVIGRDFRSVHALVPADEVTDELADRLEASRGELPRLDTAGDTGAIDVRLVAADGRVLKHGSLIVRDAGPDGRPIPIDPVTRRFRQGGLPAGDYTVYAACAGVGTAEARVAIRRGDVTRLALPLTGPEPSGAVSLRLAVSGASGDRLHVRATNRGTGKTAFDGELQVVDGHVTVAVAGPGRYHLELLDALATSCYDVDADDESILRVTPPLLVELLPPVPRPDPPDWLVVPDQLEGIAGLLPRLGIDSMQALGQAEPEALLHRAREAGIAVHTRMLAAAIEAAQRHTGVAPASGHTRIALRMARGRTMTTAFRLEQPGTISFAVEAGRGRTAAVTLDGPAGTETHTVEGSGQFSLEVPAPTPDGAVVRVTVTNPGDLQLAGSLDATVLGVSPAYGTIVQTPIETRIGHIYQAVATQNPGISTSVNPAVMAPQNIRMWLDHARTIMHELGVCSIADLGTLRIEPNQLLGPGAYVAPRRRPLNPLALQKYAFAGVINDSVLHYVPNEVLHEMAVIIGGEWDIRGRQIIIAKEVRELLVIVESIGFDAASSITWQMPSLPVPHTYWPDTAPNGGHANFWGMDGLPGSDGDPNPPPHKNGGASAVTPAPIVTMYILDATGNLPPIDLGGQNGAPGGLGQHGGNGGNGYEGLRAEGTFFGGCCRGAGWGGDGGRGGNGGRGGRGGNGGEGGKMTLLTTAPGIVALEASPPSIDIMPGDGGFGGSPGAPGKGGAGGPAGTADCEIWCDDHPERKGSPGVDGSVGLLGVKGDDGPGPASDAFQIIPITEEEWNEAFNNPHIFELVPPEVEPGDYVTVHGANFDPDLDHVFFDGQDMGSVFSPFDVVFQVPETAEGGYHPVVIRPPGLSKRRSNKAQLHVLPKLDPIPSNTRWEEGDAVTLTGLAFRSGCTVLAEDWSTNPVTSFTLPTFSVTRTTIELTIPNPPLANLRGVRRILVRNPSGGTTKDERVARIGGTIVVRCVAFRAVGNVTGVKTAHSVSQIASLFTEGNPDGVAVPFAQARIAFVLSQPVTDLLVDDDDVNMWPDGSGATQAALQSAYVPGALNFIFAKDVEGSTAFAWYGGGPLVIGDEPDQILNPAEYRHVVAHEIGHALCLSHVCDIGDDPDGGFFGRDCTLADEPYLMHPYWNVSEQMVLPQGQIDAARVGATSFETGKTIGLPFTALFMGNNPLPARCMTADTQD